MPEDDTCVATKNDGEPCTYTAKYDDGKCGIHSEENERSVGRPSIFEDVKEDILVGARQGMTIEGCARLAGVDESTLHLWLDDKPEFFKSFNRARAQGELKHIQSVNDRGSQFLLERSYGYTKTERHEVDGNLSLDELTISFEDTGSEK